MSNDQPRRGLADDLAGRSDDELAELLIARPDLASPPPRGTAVLAQRALSAASLTLVGERIDLLAVAVVEAFIDAAAATAAHDILGPVPATEIVTGIGQRATKDEITERITRLTMLGVFWNAPPAPGRRKSAGLLAGVHLSAVLPWRTSCILGPLALVDPAELQTRLDALAERPRQLLETLAAGPAIGRSRDAGPDGDPASPVARLLGADLLARVDEQTVELPPQVGQLLRGQPPLPTAVLSPPSLGAQPGRFTASQIDAAGGGEAVELLRHAGQVAEVLAELPAAALRSGGAGIRELRRIGKSADLAVPRVALLIELLGAAHLIDCGLCDPLPEGLVDGEFFAPTDGYDPWLRLPPQRRWYDLAHTWLTLPRWPAHVGEPDATGGSIPALTPDAADAGAPLVRRLVLEPLADVASAHPVTAAELTAALGWRHPRQLRRLSVDTVRTVLAEATDLGLVAHDVLTAVGRAMLTETDSGHEHSLLVQSAMSAALPEPVDHFLVQADLTLMVPGPMTPELAEQVTMVADLESGGAASVYRITEDSLRRALDTGRTGAELTGMFTAHSRTPVPQSLTYLIEDVARRHGQLRVGLANSFVRCEDATQLAAVLRSGAADAVALRALAPTVAVSPANVREVLSALRAAGFAPAGEDSSGTLVDLRTAGARVRARRRAAHPARRRSTLTPSQAVTVVGRLRTADRAEGGPVSVMRASGDGESTSALIGLALRTGRSLRVGYVDAHGSASRHVVRAQALDAGALIAEEAGEPARFPLHRITAVELL